MKNILCIDPGTKCGWAAEFEGGKSSGVWDLSVQRYEGSGMRFVRLSNFLETFHKVDLIVFEEVRRHAGTLAAHVYGGIVGIITSFAESRKINYISVPVQTIKKFATGKGNAKKDQMIEACIEKLKITPSDDNHADALWILAWAKETYGKE